MIADARVEIHRHPLRQSSWLVRGHGEQAIAWLQRHDLPANMRFPTRDAALPALTALHAFEPIPDHERHHRVTLIRAGVSEIGLTYYRTSDGSDIEVFGVPGDGWQVRDGDVLWSARTLRDAAVLVNQIT